MKAGIGDTKFKRNFILQQGLPEPAAQHCSLQYSSLTFQPRVVGLILLVGILLQESWVFLLLAGLLWWSALFPRLNPFDAAYNLSLARRPGHLRLSPAPAPRRFAAGMAGTFALAVAGLLQLGWTVAALVVEGIFIAAVVAVAFGGFCLGSFLFHLLRGRFAFAKRTLPWARDDRAL